MTITEIACSRGPSFVAGVAAGAGVPITTSPGRSEVPRGSWATASEAAKRATKTAQIWQTEVRGAALIIAKTLVAAFTSDLRAGLLASWRANSLYRRVCAMASCRSTDVALPYMLGSEQ